MRTMMKRLRASFGLLCFGSLLMLPLAACEDDGMFEDAGEEIDEAVDEVEDELDNDN